MYIAGDLVCTINQYLMPENCRWVDFFAIQSHNRSNFNTNNGTTDMYLVERKQWMSLCLRYRFSRKTFHFTDISRAKVNGPIIAQLNKLRNLPFFFDFPSIMTLSSDLHWSKYGIICEIECVRAKRKAGEPQDWAERPFAHRSVLTKMVRVKKRSWAVTILV
jgi:hypothetical protein